MKVLSLFDGISCGQLALNRAGIKVEKYFASEIDKAAIKVTQHNFPNTIQLGDITKVRYNNGVIFSEFGEYTIGEIDLVCGGSPCQSLSGMGDGTGLLGKSGLFYHFIRILKEVNPKYFLLENVKMKPEWEKEFNEHMGVLPVLINSSNFSAQNRKRLYWTNIVIPKITDNGVYLKDILEDIKLPKTELITKDGVSFSTDDSFYGYGGVESFQSWCRKKGINRIKTEKYNINVEYSKNEKSSPGVRPKHGEGIRANRYRVEHIKGLNDKSRCVAASCSSISNTSGTGVFHNGVYRRLTCLEVERLQTLPDNYTSCIPESKRYHAVGNGWTIDVISHIFKGIQEGVQSK